MNGRIIVVVISILAISTIILPQTVSLFAGQHYWYDLSGTGNDIPCEKCHADIVAEMESLITVHTGETGYGRMKCEYCHRLFPIEHQNASFTNYTYARVSGSYTSFEPGKEAHAASTVPCMYCHSGDKAGFAPPSGLSLTKHDPDENCTGCHIPGVHGNVYVNNDDCRRCHVNASGSGTARTSVIYIPPAGGFGLTINSSDTGSLAAHRAFVYRSIEEDTLTDANEACIACHTAMAVKINWTHSRSIEFEIGLGDTITTDYGPHNWTITNWQINGTAYAITWGNTSGFGTTEYNSSVWPGNIDNIYS